MDNELECTNGIDSINFEVDEVDITSSFVQRGKEVDESLEEVTRFEREYTRISCFTTFSLQSKCKSTESPRKAKSTVV